MNGLRILSEDGKNQLREQTIAQLEENPASSELWGLIQLLGFEWLPDAEAARVQGIVKTLSPPDGSAGEASSLIGHTVAAILPYSDADTHTAFETRLIETARRFASTFDVPFIDIRADTRAANAAGMIVELAVFLARGPALSGTATELGRICKQVAAEWPALAAALRALLSRTLRELPSLDGAEVWNALVTLRAMA